MALGTDVSELNEVPGTGVIPGNIQVPVKIPGSARGVLHRVPASRLPGAGNATPGGPGAQTLSLSAAQALRQAGNVAPGAYYTIAGATWNGNKSATVYVQGRTPSSFEPSGTALDSNDVPQLVRVDIGAGTYDTKPLRDHQLFQASEVNQAGQVQLWTGEATTGAAVIKEVLV